MFSIKKYSTVKDFIDENENLMIRNEAMNSLMYGLVTVIKNGTRRANGPIYLALLEEGKIVSLAVKTDPSKPLILSEFSKEGILYFSNYIKENYEVKTVVGPTETVDRFVSYFDDYSLKMDQGLYQLTEVIMPRNIKGEMILANNYSSEIVKELIYGFAKEATPADPRDEKVINAVYKRYTDDDSLYLWLVDGEVVSMAGVTRETANGGCLALVYTPNDQRGNGYGSMITASLSKLLLDSGKEFCALYTDLSNPTSNSIYQKIGYKRIGDSRMYYINS